MGSDREEGEDEAEVIKEGDRARRQAEELYQAQVCYHHTHLFILVCFTDYVTLPLFDLILTLFLYHFVTISSTGVLSSHSIMIVISDFTSVLPYWLIFCSYSL